jgi:hypothetical protein
MATGGPKPLSKAGRAKVLKVAREHSALGRVLKGRARPVVVASYPEAREGGEGQALVAVYDYDRDRTFVATVDPGRERVLSVDEAPVPFQLSEEEREEAAALAATDERVKRFLGRRPMNPLTRLYFPPDGGPHRHAVVFLRPNRSERAYAVVDLSDGRVVDVLSRERFTGEET